MRSTSDTLNDIEEIARCLQREAEVSYAKDSFTLLFEDAYRRVDVDLNGAAQMTRALVQNDRPNLVVALRNYVGPLLG